MQFSTIASGSSGNCCYIGSAAGGVLVDAGVSARRIETALREREIDPGSIRAICVTHEQSIADQTDKIIRLRDGVISSIDQTGLGKR